MSSSSTPAEIDALGLTPALLDDRLPIPLYHQVRLLLTERIRRGDLPAGSVLPGEHQIAEQLGASRITVKRALNELAGAGLVTRHRGRGTMVTPQVELPVITGSFSTMMDSLRTMGHETQVELLETGMEPASAEVARALGLALGDPVRRIVRVRRLGGAPFSYLISWLPAAVADNCEESAFAEQSMLSLLEQAGALPHEAELWVSAVGAVPAVSAALEVAVGSPLLRIERIMRKADGTAVQFINAHYHAERFRYHLLSRRDDSQDWKAQG
ncbi:GntR family transcriptional regulator [Brevundimonas faecalis]|uniref:GntR family transcriptional regulator n=1 Tax=Brevundimonas faecalis TaxID=947378 RepID=A0ABV2RBJ0_9CAUL